VTRATHGGGKVSADLTPPFRFLYGFPPSNFVALCELLLLFFSFLFPLHFGGRPHSRSTPDLGFPSPSIILLSLLFSFSGQHGTDGGGWRLFFFSLSTRSKSNSLAAG